MLADVVKQRDIERARMLEEERNKWKEPVLRDTIIYYNDVHIIGGIETWIYNLSLEYDFTLVYRTADDKQLERLKKNGIECIKDMGQPIACSTLIFTLIGFTPEVRASRKILFIHGDYDSMDEIGDIPKVDEVYGVSDYVCDKFTKLTGIACKTMYNPVVIERKDKVLFLGVFSRLSSEKGKKRIIYLLDELTACNKPFLMFIFTDLPFEYPDNRVIFIKPTLDNKDWIDKMDYIIQLSDKEAACLTIQESLKMGKPVIVTKLPMLKEFKINESEAKILEFDMSNLDIEDLWNIPKVNWSEPVSNGWENIMKKKVFKDRNKITEEVIAETEFLPKNEDTKEEIKKETKKVTRKKKKDE